MIRRVGFVNPMTRLSSRVFFAIFGLGINYEYKQRQPDSKAAIKKMNDQGTYNGAVLACI